MIRVCFTSILEFSWIPRLFPRHFPKSQVSITWPWVASTLTQPAKTGNLFYFFHRSGGFVFGGGEKQKRRYQYQPKMWLLEVKRVDIIDFPTYCAFWFSEHVIIIHINSLLSRLIITTPQPLCHNKWKRCLWQLANDILSCFGLVDAQLQFRSCLRLGMRFVLEGETDEMGSRELLYLKKTPGK